MTSDDDRQELAALVERKRARANDPKRLRRENRSEAPIGKFIEEASREGDARVLRSVKGPPPTPEEAELIAGAPHVPVQLFGAATVTDLETGERERYKVVPDDEANFEAGRLSIGSPIGRALLQEYPGAVVEVKTPVGKRLYRVLYVK